MAMNGAQRASAANAVAQVEESGGLADWMNSILRRGTRGASIGSPDDFIPEGTGNIRLGGQSTAPILDVPDMYDFYGGDNNLDEQLTLDITPGANDNIGTPVEAVVDAVAPKRAGKAKTPKKQIAKRTAVRKAVKQPVAKQKRFATVDPLNLFGNKNGANPLDSVNRGSNRFSGGIVDQRVNDASYPQARGSYGFNANDPINLF